MIDAIAMDGKPMAKVYAMSNQVFLREPLVKIGLTTDLERRKDQLERGQPFPLESIAEIEVPQAYTREVESFLHDALAPLRHDKGEWFRISRERVVSVFEKVEHFINVGHAIDGLRLALAVFDEIAQSTTHAASDAASPADQPVVHDTKDRQRRGVDFRPYVPDGTKIRYGTTEDYCTRRGDYLITKDGESHPTLSAALAHIVKLRGGKSKPDGWRHLRIRQGHEWIPLRSLRTDLPDDVRRKR
ncbi:MAG: GIY-YIG nuclease family protein [Gammaproteobacteria bacterium]|nr:GIY-YIG nuclease family protein [Gammaproteobacteria bacterium]